MRSPSLVVVVPGFRPTALPFGVAVRHARLTESLRARLLKKGLYEFALYDWHQDRVVQADAAATPESFATFTAKIFLGTGAATLANLLLAGVPLVAAAAWMALQPLKRDFLKQQSAASTAGQMLRDRIVEWGGLRDLRGRYRYESITLVGFSLGCAVLNAAFRDGLGQDGYVANRLAPCFYIAPAVPHDQPPATSLPVNNFYSDRDAVLRWLYPRATGCKAAGYHGFKSPNVQNFHHRVGHLEHGDPNGTAAFIASMIP